MGNPFAPGLTPAASETLPVAHGLTPAASQTVPTGVELSALSAATSSAPLLHQVQSCSRSAAGIMLLLQLALKERAYKQCCIMLLSCKQNDSRSFLGCILCMIVARLCCFTGLVCMNTTNAGCMTYNAVAMFSAVSKGKLQVHHSSSCMCGMNKPMYQ